MAVQYYNANVKNPETGEQGMWYYTGMSVDQATDAVATGGGTYRAVAGEVPVMTPEKQTMTTTQFKQTYSSAYPSVPVTATGLASPIPTTWPAVSVKEGVAPVAGLSGELLELEIMARTVAYTSPASTDVMTSIINAFSSVSSLLYKIYLEVYSWIWPFWLVASFFYTLSDYFAKIAWGFYYFSDWVTVVGLGIKSILSWSTIWSYILSHVPNLVAIRDWFYSWWRNIWNEVSDWWDTTKPAVQGWITAATQGFNSVVTAWSNFWNNLWPELMSSYNGLKSAWDSFWKVTFPNMVSNFSLETWWNNRLKDVDELMKSKLKEWFPFYDSFSKLWGDVAKFITDPVEFIWQRFADWFLGPEG